MKICGSPMATSLNTLIYPPCGLGQYFMIMDSDTLTFEVVLNEADQTSSRAGIHAAQTMVRRKADVVITGNIGPKALHTLFVANKKIVPSAFGTVRAAFEGYSNGELTAVSQPTVDDPLGVGRTAAIKTLNLRPEDHEWGEHPCREKEDGT